jgi:hypothetical protein
MIQTKFSLKESHIQFIKQCKQYVVFPKATERDR